MSTRSRIGILLPDDSILSVYHHWDGYPEWLGVTLKEHFNTYEKASELIDGGNMGCCYSDEEYNSETREYEKTEPRATYYGGKEEAPILSKNFTQFAFDSKSGEEYLYLFVDNEWNGFSLDHKYSEEDWEILDTKVNPIEIPEPEVA